MSFEDLKEQLLDVGRKINEKLEEQPTYVQLKERFEGLSPQMQKLTILAVSVFIWLVILSIPWGWSSNAQMSVESFEARRALVRDLLKISREASEVPPLPPPPPIDTIRGDIENLLKSSQILPEQIKSVENSVSTSQMIPAEKSTGSIAVTVTKLNVQQAVDAGTQLSNLSPSIKMVGLQMAANKEDRRYFDVTYRLTALAVPDLSAPPPDEPPGSPGRGRR